MGHPQGPAAGVRSLQQAWEAAIKGIPVTEFAADTSRASRCARSILRLTMALLYCYYGDDFTGSTDVLEQLAINGVSSVLFLTPPTPAQLARFSDRQAIGFAGDARSRTPEWMSAHLPAIFTRIRELAPAVAHYKVCSTFDSAPHRGSIGRALEIGREVFATQTVPIGVAAPHLGRFMVFGHLFAAAGNEVYRIDRHPTMAHHPATPMHEADLRIHLAGQTNLAIGLVDLRAFQAGKVEEQFRRLAERGAAAVLLDGIDGAMLQQAGELIWELKKGSQPVFTIGSSGVTASLIAHWRSTGIIAAEPLCNRYCGRSNPGYQWKLLGSHRGADPLGQAARVRLLRARCGSTGRWRLSSHRDCGAAGVAFAYDQGAIRCFTPPWVLPPG